MKEVFLSNRGDALVPVTDEGFDALAKYPKNQVLRVKITQTRSLPHHSFFFAFLAYVYAHWPDTHKMEHADEEVMRAWLLVRAGIKESAIVEWRSIGASNPFIVSAMLKGVIKGLTTKPTWFAIDTHAGTVEIMYAKSIAFHRMEENEFREVTTKVFDVVYVETGLDVDDFYNNWSNKNGKLKVEPRRSITGN